MDMPTAEETKKKNIIVYYAHPKTHYDTELEYDCFEFLNTAFGTYGDRNWGMEIEIFNPNKPIISRVYQNRKFISRVYQNRKYEKHPDSFELFRELARASDILVMTTFLDGILGAGVAEEGKQSILAGKKVFVLSFYDIGGNPVKSLSPVPSEALKENGFEGLEVLTYEETVERLKNGIQ
jgi:hypothetical protein